VPSERKLAKSFACTSTGSAGGAVKVEASIAAQDGLGHWKKAPAYCVHVAVVLSESRMRDKLPRLSASQEAKTLL
jgi:hypothetical protein